MRAFIGSRALLAIIFTCLASISHSQPIPDSLIKKIDQLFVTSKGANGPGYAVGIVRNDSLIFSKGYGLANLEYSIPISPESIFHMASVTKQFTTYCILLLERQGKLSLDDDVRKHLPWFPDLKQKITLRHMMNNTSGIRDHWDLNVLSNRRMDDVITQDYLVTLLSRQKALNFTPGEKYSYSNSNFTMLAEVVKNVSGMPFRKFADSAIFKPLGMESTHMHDDHTEMVPNRAYSYRPVDADKFANAVLNYSNAGATSLFTNIQDMSKWLMNFYSPKVGDAITVEKMTSRAILNNGTRIPYAMGILVDEYNGKRRFTHSGADAGYRSNVAVFPDERLGFMVFSNLSTANTVTKTTELIDVFMQRGAGKPAIDSSLAKLANAADWEKYMGNYISDDGVRFSYSIKDQQIYWNSPAGNQLLARSNQDTLFSLVNPEVKFVFTSKNSDIIVDQYLPDNNRRLRKIPPAPTDPDFSKLLVEYAGSYYSEETESKTVFTVSGSKLQLADNMNINRKSNLEYLQKDQFAIGGTIFNFKRDEKNQVIGVELNTGRSRNVVFMRSRP